VASKHDALLGQIAVEMGMITEEQLAACCKEQEATRRGTGPRPLGEILLEKGLVRKKDMEALIEEQNRRVRSLDRYQKIQKVEYLFGQLLVKNNLATQLQINKCLEIQVKMAEKGDSKIPRLGELLVEHGFVDKKTVEQVLKMQDKDVLTCPACGKQLNVVSSEEGKTYRCPGCGAGMVRPARLDSLRAEDSFFGFELPSEER
jgi:predicted RNA-binding Zn-ribbon protein involved in translation (DUF1610 family)